MTLFNVRKQEREALKRHASNAKASRVDKWHAAFFISGMATAAVLVSCLLGLVDNTANAENSTHRGETTSQISHW